MSLNDGYLQGGNPEVNLRDYKHASKVFRDANFRLAPKHDHMFHVAFDFASGIGFGETDATDRLQAGLMVKSVDLPSFKIENKVNNAYNRKNVIQSKIEYGSVNITFHDDSANLTNSIWQSYYEYYYGDSYGNDSEYGLNTKYNDRTRTDWGYIPPNKPYFNSIRIYSLSQGKYTGYTLINPLITSWKHGKHDTAGDGIMENQMEITYETLLYSHGEITEDGEEPKFFTDIGYDNEESPLGKGIGIGPPKSVEASGGAIRSSNNIFDQFLEGDITGGVLDVILTGDRDALKQAAGASAVALGKDILTGRNVNEQYNFPGPVREIIASFQESAGGRIIQAGAVQTGNAAPVNSIVTSNGTKK